MIFVTAAAFILVSFCGYWLLQLGPARSITRRVGMYARLVCIAGLLVWVFLSTQDSARSVADMESVPCLIGLFAFHSAAAIACFWMKWTGRYHLGWFIVVIAGQIVWALFLIVNA